MTIRDVRRRMSRLENNQPGQGVSFWDVLAGVVELTDVADLDDAGKEILREWNARLSDSRLPEDTVERRMEEALCKPRVRQSVAEARLPNGLKELPTPDASTVKPQRSDPRLTEEVQQAETNDESIA